MKVYRLMIDYHAKGSFGSKRAWLYKVWNYPYEFSGKEKEAVIYL